MINVSGNEAVIGRSVIGVMICTRSSPCASIISQTTYTSISTHTSWNALVGEVVERDAFVAEAEPPGQPRLVLDLVVVDAVGGQALHQLHVTVDRGECE